MLNAMVNFAETLPRAARAPLRLHSAARTYGEIVRDVDFVLPGIALTGAFFFLFAYVGGAGYAYQSEFGLSVESFGFVFGGTGVAVLLGAMLAGRLVARIRIQMLAVAGVSLLCLGSFVALIAGTAGIDLAGVVAGMAIAMLGLGIAEATLMSIAMSARDTAVGASVAVLGAFQLGVAGLATPLAGQMVAHGVGVWLSLLMGISLVVMVLTAACAYRSARNGRTVAIHH
ncbi:hypothetical protein [Paracoccus sp. KR1-242]|uniref:hypothetical protein n=1 Tax=Paracoccus sp. KR1-242 TaxID=3410028 RepID=UPI003C02A3F0